MYIIEQLVESPVLNERQQLAKCTEDARELAQNFSKCGSIDDLNAAIDLYGQLAGRSASSADMFDVGSYLNLGKMILIKFEAYSEITDLDSAVDDALMKAYALVTNAHPLYIEILFELIAASPA